MSEHERPPLRRVLRTTDARLWAEEFMATFGDCNVDVETLTGWFANAIEVGREAGAGTTGRDR